MGNFNPQNLGNTAWAFASAGRNDALFFAALATAVEQRMGDFNSQELAITAWAVAMVAETGTSFLPTWPTAPRLTVT